MKKITTILVSALCLCWFCIPVHSVSAETEQKSVYEEFQVDDLEQATPKEILSIYRELEITPENPMSDESTDLLTIVQQFLQSCFSDYSVPVHTLGVLIVVAILTFLTSNLTFKSCPWLPDVCDLVALAACATILISPISELFQQVSDAMASSTVYMNAFVPVFTALLAASGFSAVSGTYSVILIAYSDGFSVLNNSAFVPCCHMLLATTVCTSVAKVPFSLINGVKKVMVSVISVLTALLTGLVGLQTRLSGIGDSLAVKAAKTALSTFVPIVGSAWGDSLSVILGSLDLVRSSVGVYTVITVLLIFVPPMVKLLIWQGVLWITGSLFEVAQKKEIAELFRSVGGLLTILVVLLLCSLLLITLTVLTVLSLRNSL